MSTGSINSSKQKYLDELFEKNRILTPTRKVSGSHIDDSDNLDNSDSSVGNLTPLTYQQVENDPKTPMYRSQFYKSPIKLSPLATTSLEFDGGQKDSPSAAQDELADDDTDKSSGIPNSILKKSTKIDKETSRKFIKKIPKLSTVVDSNNEINPVKAAKVVFSPHKLEIPSFIASSPSKRRIRISSPLSDSLKQKKRTASASAPATNAPASATHIKKNKKKLSIFKLNKFNSLFDPQLPYILSLYLQLIFNVIIVSILLYFVYSFISTIKSDVDLKVESYSTEILQEIALCSREYLRNNCQPGKRVVALEAVCSDWEKCMNRDPTIVSKAKIGAETFAEILNGFIKPISWKSMVFLFLITVGSLILTNAAFGTYRNYSQYDASFTQFQKTGPSLPNGSAPSTAATPNRQISYNPNYTHYYTPKLTPRIKR